MAMTDKHANRTDERIRQALSRLPDAPPPGSAFDAGRLWEQFRPQLPTQPVAAPQRRVGGWWLAAAACAGLLLSGWWLLWWQQRTQPHLPVVMQVRTQPTPQPDPIARQVTPSPRVRTQARRDIPTSDKKGQVAINQPAIPQTTVESDSLSGHLLVNVPSLSATPTLPDSQVAVAAVIKPALPGNGVLRKQPLQRFRVVHQNDLRAEAESQARLERNEHFVRLGSKPPTLNEQPDRKPTLIIPLN
jgi:hypothetical protein